MDIQEGKSNIEHMQFEVDLKSGGLSSLDSQAMFREILNLSDIDPDSYSPCYEMVRVVIQEYATMPDLPIIDMQDMALLYCCITYNKPSKESLDDKIQAVKSSHLSDESKERLIRNFQSIDPKIRNRNYTSIMFDNNDSSYWRLATLLPGVAAGMNDVFNFPENPAPRNFIKFCIEMLEPCKDLNALVQLDHVFPSMQYFSTKSDDVVNEKNRAGFSIGPFSSILHALKPSAFPPIYGKGKLGDTERGIGAFQKLFQFDPSPMMSFAEFASYPKIYRTLFEFKEKNKVSWSNYIVLIDYWFKNTEKLKVINGELEIGKVSTKRKDVDDMAEKETSGNLIDGFSQYVQSQGFSFPRDILATYVLSLQTKPFVILSGISGTGKTKIAQLFAEYMSEQNEKAESPKLLTSVFLPKNESIYKLQEYNFKYRYIYIPKVLWSSLSDLPEKKRYVKVDLEIDGKIQTTYLLWGSTIIALSLGKQIYGQFTNFVMNHQLKVGDPIAISVVHGIDQDKIILKILSEENQKEVKVSAAPKRHAFISVRPDWTDNKGLLGFYNPLVSENQYQPTELLKIMLNADKDPEHPYFVILDEMNLAKVEYYFSDFLSCLESRRPNGTGGIKSEKILLHDADTLTYTNDEEAYEIPGSLEIPENLYFTGTINVDESTYMFSPKVLDRANVIEFNDVNMDLYFYTMSNRIDDKAMGNDSTKPIYATSVEIQQFTNQGQFCRLLITKAYDVTALSESYNKLHSLHSILNDHNMHFGYRVIDEIMTNLALNEKYTYFNDPATAFDRQVLQKILPKIHGNRRQLENVLELLLEYALNNQCPESTRKIERMKTKLANTGYTSYIE